MVEFPLEKLTRARQDLAECNSAAQAKEFVSLSKSAAEYAKVKQMGEEAVNYANEMTLYAYRRMGELLREQPKNKGSRSQLNGRHSSGGSKVEPPENETPTLKEQGISKRESMVSQQIAGIPNTQFEGFISKAKDKGKGLTTSKALSIAKSNRKAKAKKEKEQAEAAKLNAKYPEVKMDMRLGDFRTALSDIEDNSIDMIVTDPPYPEKYLPLWSDMAEMAARVLKPGGYVFAYSGQMFLPNVMAGMAEHLDYVWMAAIKHNNGYTQLWKHELLVSWKPLLIYSKGKPSKKLNWFKDMISAGTGDKDSHEWAQPQGEAEYIIGKMLPNGGTILDPFMGSGTTMRAAKSLGVHSVGAEIESKYF